MRSKDSGLECLGRVPSHWSVAPVRHWLTRIEQGWSPQCESRPAVDGEWGVLKAGCVNGGRYRPDENKALPSGEAPVPSLEVRPGDLLMSRANTRELQGSAALVRETPPRLMLCDKLYRLRYRNDRLDPRFLELALQSNPARFQMEREATGSSASMVNISQDTVRRIVFAWPPLEEQRAIVSFLERRTAVVDRLIEKKERIVALLQEKRQAVVTAATTKGLDPRVPTKDSGSPWIERVPAHWTVRPLMVLTPSRRPIMYGIVLPGPDVPDGVPIVKAGNVAPGRLRPEFLKRTTHEIEERFARARLAANDVVFAIRGSVGSAEIVSPEVAGANITQDVARVAPGEGVHPQWLLSVLRSAPTQAQAAAFTTGATVKGLNIGDLKRILVAVPPLAEQQAISDHVDRVTGALNESLFRLERTLELLREYRHALVTAAVTGKIDVMKPVGAA